MRKGRVLSLALVGILVVAGIYTLRRSSGGEATGGASRQVADGGVAPLRILSLSPNVTEILFRLGLGEEVAGVTDFCRFPPEAIAKPKVGALLNPNLEKMFALEPTLVIALPAHGTLPEKLAARGIRSLVVRNDTVEDVFASIASIGAATERSSEASALVDSIRATISGVRSAPPARRWRTMIVVSRSPGSIRDVFVAGPGTYLDELLRMAGGTNVFADAAARYPEPGAEEILHRNPELIVEVRPLGKDAAVETRLARADWGALPGLDAGERANVFSLVGDHLLVPGPRLGEALADIARVLREAH
jgi:iron complex transport system substrate-binding protein